MLSNLPSSLASLAGPGLLRRLARPAALTAVVAATLGAGSVAHAADCVNGYRTLGNQVILLCEDAGPGQSTALFPQAAPPVAPAEPMTTGSAAPRRSGSIMVDSVEDCEPGMYWTYYLEDGEVTLAC
jgi:hypothetical protein